MTEFYDWLMTKRNESNPIGDLACDAYRDSTWPDDATALADLVDHLRGYGAVEGAITALTTAWEAWEAERARADGRRGGAATI